jgi:hypothetical protein
MPDDLQHGAILDMRGVPPLPDRLMTAVELLVARGRTRIIMQWGDRFPWSFSSESSSRLSYAEEVISGLCRRARNAGAEIISGCNVAGGLIEACMIPEYRRLGEFAVSIGSFHAGAGAALRMARSIVEDMLSLDDSGSTVYLGGEESGGIGVPPSLYFDRYLEPLVQAVLESGVTPILHEAALAGLKESELSALAAHGEVIVLRVHGKNDEPGAKLRSLGYTLWARIPAWFEEDGALSPRPAAEVLAEERRTENHYPVSVVDCRVRFSVYEPDGVLLEEYIGLLFSPGAGPKPVVMGDPGPKGPVEAHDAAVTARVAEAAQCLRESLRDTWTWIRRARECLVLAVDDVRRRRRNGPGVERFINLAKLSAGTSRLYAHEIRSLVSGFVDEPSLDRFFAERIGPVEEDIAVLEARFRQLSIDP